MNVMELLQYGRARVKRGWIQGTEINTRGDVCATGAVLNTYPQGVRGVELSRGTRMRANGYLIAALPFGRTGTVECWNDEPGRTKAEVLSLFDQAIKLAARRKRAPSSIHW